MNANREEPQRRTQGVVELLDRAMRDPTFRTRLRGDPEGTARALRLEMGAAEWAGISDLLRP
jgi:hypothetical protein